MDRRTFLGTAGAASFSIGSAGCIGSDGPHAALAARAQGQRTVNFPSCYRAEVTGRFEEGDMAFANLIYYTESGVGNSILKHGVVFGEDVSAPFEGTVVMEVCGDTAAVYEHDSVIEIDIPGGDRVAIGSITTSPMDYRARKATHTNPNNCETQINPDDGKETSPGAITITQTNTPIHSGDRLTVNADIVNATSQTQTGPVTLVVGDDPQQVDSLRLQIRPETTEYVRLGYSTPTVSNTQQFPVRVAFQGTEASQPVRVYGANDSDAPEPRSRTRNMQIVDLTTNAPIVAGEQMTVTAKIRNTEEAVNGRATARLIVGDTPTQVDSVKQLVRAGTTETLELGYTTPRVQRTQEFPLRVQTNDDDATQTVEVSESVRVYGTG